jgi:hypothetical protein
LTDSTHIIKISVAFEFFALRFVLQARLTLMAMSMNF